jgi:predicted O-methyltransferase YrrM
MRYYKDIPGWFGFEWFYAKMADRLPDGARIVETGTLFGASATFLVDTLEHLGKSAEIHLVDLFDDRFRGEASHAIAKPHGSPRNAFEFYAHIHRLFHRSDIAVHVHQCNSINLAREFEDGSLDFVFLDSGHKYEHVRAEIEAFVPKIHPDGAIAGHDYGNKKFGVKQAVDEFFGATSVVKTADSCWYRQLNV